ncbi:hypothetical protein H2202_000058 [Exophiala xenobiotica]|nr:hypothetical protein H2202_000058 [Exophiala xenobiotica]KAK5236776.1 hypothetical protein LTR47_001954 [Exophiala xenobiotica]KAK5251100.1 hypothetical protein LTS06_004250 [Exophiala xenobiotica]KAK5259916.1 hypothetical protein LTR40_005089 [Exophiala xenobiotica]KAK5356335.1 hypothetical protein LTR61_000070 [Exophiala xenobiotica]
MLPDFLKDSYKQYKTDTDRFATWLVNVAKKCGYEPEDLTPTPSLDANGKGKRKKNTNQSKALEPEKYQISIRELCKVAQAVSKSTVKVPTSVLAVAKRAITLRKDVTSYFVGQGNAASNQRHAHFIEVMEDICKSLECDDEDTSAAAKKDDKGVDLPNNAGENADDQAWLNRFAALTVEDIEDTTETISERSEMVKVVAVEDEEAADPDDDEAYLSHAFFRVFCLFHDLQKWRNFLSETWTEYGDRKVDLMTASVVTDNALQLARELIQEVVADLPPEFPQHGTELQELVYASSCLHRDGLVCPDTQLGLTFSLDMADVAEWCYLGVGSLLHSFVPVIKSDTIPLYKPGYFGVYNSKADRSQMSIPEKFSEDKLILLELLPEFCLMESFKLKFPVRDEITTGLIDFIKSKRPTLWLSFAIQVMLDAIHATRHSRLSAWSDLRMTSLRITKTIDDFWKLSKTHPKPRFWPSEGDEEIRRIRKCIETLVEEDPLQCLKEESARTLGRPSYPSPDHLMLSRNPVLCGLMTFQLNLRMQTIGQALVTQWYDVPQLAFLYNLVQQSPGQTLSWPDMELFIKIHGEERIFIGNRPKDAAQSINRLEIVTGVSSVARLASDSRQRSHWHRPDGKNARHLEPTTKVTNLFRERYQYDDPAKTNFPSLCSANVSTFLDELSETSTKKNKTKKSKPDKGKELALALSSPDEFLGRRWQNTHNVGALQLLALIKGKLGEEEPVLLFNYFAMHRRSIEILRLIQKKEHHKFVQYFTERYMPDDSYISNLVILVHHVARGSAIDGEKLGLTGRDTQLMSRMVISCGDVMREYLAKQGDGVSRELRVFCRNKKFLAVEDGKAGQNKEVDNNTMYVLGLEQVLTPQEMESLRTGIRMA